MLTISNEKKKERQSVEISEDTDRVNAEAEEKAEISSKEKAEDENDEKSSAVEKSKQLLKFTKDENDKMNFFQYEETAPEYIKKKKFAHGLNFYKLFWVFFIGSFIGVIIEIIFCILVTEHHYECRQGVIYGPFNPVYGFGAVLITLALYVMRNARDLWVFICGALLGGAFEYICSWYQETFLGTVSWTYEGQIGNIGGRTSLVFMLFWGILAILWLKFLYPLMAKCIEKLPMKLGKILTWILVVFMVLNMLISALAVYRMTQRHSGATAKNAYEEFMDTHYPDSFLMEIYPHMEVSNPKYEK